MRPIDPNFDQGIRVFSSNPSVPSAPRRTGAWDRTILCLDCEKRYQRYDDHAVKVLSAPPIETDRWGRGIRELHGADAAKLKLFFMHVLWRANESHLPDYASVNIGPRAAALRELLLRDDPGTRKDFPVVLWWHPPDPEGLHLVVSSFFNGKWPNGARFFQLQVHQWLVVITTSSIGMPTDYHRLALTPAQPVPVCAGRTFREGWIVRRAFETFRARQDVDN
jgi:hypothetical protein